MAKLHRRVSEALYRLHTLPSPSKPIFHRTISSNTFRATHNSATPLRNTFRSFSSSIFPYGISNSSKTITNPKLIFTQICRHSTNSTSPSQKISSFSSKNLGFTSKLKFDPLGFKRHFSKLDGSIVEKPVSAVKSVFSRYRQAIGLQIEAFWKRNYLFLVGAGAVGVCLVLWRLMFGIANSFVGLSEGMAKYGFLALSSAIVAFAGIYIRSRFTINPDRVYRIAMRKLNTSASILEVMGAPLSGTDVRAYVMSGGGLTLKNFKLKLSSKRCFLIFPIQGSERKGLVSVEVKKKKGQYDMKLLAVDIPMMVGADQRFFLEGDEDEYKIGGGLIGVLRDPIVKAMAAQKEFEALDQKEEEEDEEKEREDAERKHREEMEKLEKSSQ